MEVYQHGYDVGGVVGNSKESDITNCKNNNVTVSSKGFITKKYTWRLEEEYNFSDIGGIVGYSYNCNMNQCINQANCVGTYSAIGGIVGFDDGNRERNIENCSNLANISVTIKENEYGVGGIAGECYVLGNIRNSTNTGNITCNNHLVGGIVGELTNSIIDGCINEGNIKGKHSAGGIAGHAIGVMSNVTEAQIKNSRNKGVIEVTGYDTREAYSIGRNEEFSASLVGGITGEVVQNATIMKCVNEKGGLRTTGKECAGGIAGFVRENATIKQCANYAKIECNQEKALGGIIGYVNQGNVEECFNQGEIKGKEAIGGILGQATKGTTKNCYNTATISGSNKIAGIIGEVVPYEYARGHVYLYNCYNIGEITASAARGLKDCWVANTNYLEFDYLYTTEDIHNIVGDGVWENNSGNQNYEAIPGTPVNIKNKMLTSLEKGNGANKWTRDTKEVKNQGYPYLINLEPEK